MLLRDCDTCFYNTKMLKSDSEECERIKEIKYLGTVFTEDNDITTEIEQRIVMANKTSCGLRKHLYSPNLKRQTKCMPHKTSTYGSECWSLSKDGNMLRIFERGILRLVYGPVNDNGIWRTGYNSELYTL